MSKSKNIIFNEDTLNKGEFYYDTATTNNPKHKIHASLQIGTDGEKWSRMSSTTSPAKNKKYIKLSNQSKAGKSTYLHKSIKTGPIASRKKKAKRPPLTDSDKGKIRSFIRSILNKKNKPNKNARLDALN